MMKTRIILVFLILCNIVSAQNYKISYIHYYDTDWPKTTPGFLFIDTKSNNILYLYQYSKSQDWKEKIGQDFPYSNKVGYDGSLRDQYFKIDNNRMITTTDYIGGEKVIITDIPSKIEWNLSREKKEIANYTCYKATTIFRGRKWEAWYTNDIPLSYGPLKFAGLPGLILEISDDTKEYTIMAEQIVRTSENFDAEFTLFKNSTNDSNKILTLKEYINKKQQNLENFAKRQNSDRGSSTFKVLPRGGIELKYEWEK